MCYRELVKSILGGYFLLCVSISHTQCLITSNVSTVDITCGDSVEIHVGAVSSGFGITEDFNNLSYNPMFTFSQAPVYTNPCGPSLDGTASAWMASNGSSPRTITTTGLDMSNGGTICFDLDFAGDDVCGGCSDCNDPDLLQEGVALEYSINNGASWVEIIYFSASSTNNENWYQWSNYCVNLPAGGYSSNTMIRWIQADDSGLMFDHWGVDNIEIVQFGAPTPGYSYYWNGSLGDADSIVFPSATTNYEIILTNGSVSCTTAVDVNVDPFDPAFSYWPDEYCQGYNNIFPDIQGDPGGIFYSASDLLVDSLTGKLNPYWVQPGTYAITYTPATGLCDAHTVYVDIIGPILDAGNDTVVAVGQPVTLTAYNPDGASISWNNGVSDGVSFVPPQGSTQYVVTGSLNGCTNNDAVVVHSVTNLEIQDESADLLEIYPNPVSSSVSIKYPGSFVVSLYDMSGKEILKQSSTDLLVLNFEKLSSGIYLIELRSEDFSLFREIVKQ